MPVEAIRHSSPRLATEDTTSVWTPDVWGGKLFDHIKNGNADGVIFERYFAGFRPSANINAAEAWWDEDFMVFGSDGASLAAAAGLGWGGGITVASDGDNEGAAIRAAVAQFKLSRASKRFAFEVVLSTSTIADTKHGFFVGLTDLTANTVAIPVADAAALADVNLVGFHRLESDGDKLDLVYKANGVTAVTVAADAITLVADTDVRLGMTFDPLPGDLDTGDPYTLRFWKNGRFIGETGYKQIPATNGDDFPNDVSLGFCFGLRNATGTTPGSTTLRRVRIAQET